MASSNAESPLNQLRINQSERLAAESIEERQAKLQQIRHRLASESAKEREARLQQMQDRQAAESPISFEPSMRQQACIKFNSKVNIQDNLIAECTK